MYAVAFDYIVASAADVATFLSTRSVVPVSQFRNHCPLSALMCMTAEQVLLIRCVDEVFFALLLVASLFTTPRLYGKIIN